MLALTWITIWSMLRTGLIVEVPDAEHVVAHWREQLDPHAMLGVPAHVTVLFPFAAPDRIDKGILTALRQVLSAGASGKSPLTSDRRIA